MKTRTDVLIAGAGPVGLLLAAELSRDGVDVLIVDPMVERSFFCKALGVTPRTLEIFEDLGILHEAISRGAWLRGVSSYLNGVQVGAMDLPADLPFGSLSLAQFETERLLEACLHRHGGAVAYGWAVEGFDDGAAGVCVRLVGPEGATQTVDCRWLVGCDGAHSKVRSVLGMAFEGGRYPQTFALADVEVDWDLPRGPMHRFNQGAPGQPGNRSLAAVPVQGATGRRYRLSTILAEAGTEAEADAEKTSTPTLGEIAALMLPMLPAGTKLSALRWSSIYRVSHRIVPEYSRGRVFLAGDAAHIHPPVGGQGMNTGLQDAHNLAWKLALASRGRASAGLLASYSAERHPVGLDVVENTSRALNEVLAQRSPLPGMRETQLLITYRGSGIVRDERADGGEASVAAGDRAPDAGQLRREYVGHAFRLHELLGRGRHVLLGFFGEDDREGADALAEMLGQLRETFGAGAEGFAVTRKECEGWTREDLPRFVDAGGEFAAAFQAQPGMAWLIRPDGHIGWCSAVPSSASLRAYLELVANVAM